MLKNSIIWALGFVIAVLAGMIAMGAIAKNKAPAFAMTLSPLNGFAAENTASSAIKRAITDNSGQFVGLVNPATTQAAQLAFRTEPLTPDAIAVLALGRGAVSKRKLMSDALSLSRRQALVTGWMIADSGAHDDVPALLSHYDTMIRSSSSAASVVIPIMASALANDKFVTPFASLLSKQPPWADQFWSAVVGTPEAIVNAAHLREALHKTGESQEVYRDAGLIRALINGQQFERADRLYSLITIKDKGSIINNGAFDKEPQYAPIDWQLFVTGEYGAAITHGKLELSAIRNAGGLFARQLIKMPERTLKMGLNPSAKSKGDAQIFITLTCAEKMTNAPQPIRILLKGGIENLQINNSQSGCNFYWLDFSGRALDNSDGFYISFESIYLS